MSTDRQPRQPLTAREPPYLHGASVTVDAGAVLHRTRRVGPVLVAVTAIGCSSLGIAGTVIVISLPVFLLYRAGLGVPA